MCWCITYWKPALSSLRWFISWYACITVDSIADSVRGNSGNTMVVSQKFAPVCHAWERFVLNSYQVSISQIGIWFFLRIAERVHWAQCKIQVVFIFCITGTKQAVAYLPDPVPCTTYDQMPQLKTSMECWFYWRREKKTIILTEKQHLSSI